jgi:hypothetical protein
MALSLETQARRSLPLQGKGPTQAHGWESLSSLFSLLHPGMVSCLSFLGPCDCHIFEENAVLDLRFLTITLGIFGRTVTTAKIRCPAGWDTTDAFLSRHR